MAEKANNKANVKGLVYGVVLSLCLLFAPTIGIPLTATYVTNKAVKQFSPMLGGKVYDARISKGYNKSFKVENTNVSGLDGKIYLDDEVFDKRFGNNTTEVKTYANNEPVIVKRYDEDLDAILTCLKESPVSLTKPEIRDELVTEKFPDKERVLNRLSDIVDVYVANNVIVEDTSNPGHYELNSVEPTENKGYVFEGNNIIFLGDITKNFSSSNEAELNILYPDKWLFKYVNTTNLKAVKRALTGLPNVIKSVNGSRTISPVDDSLLNSWVLFPQKVRMEALDDFLKNPTA